MRNVNAMPSLTKKRLQKFHQKCRGACSSKKQFSRSFLVDDYHITQQGQTKNPKRLSLNHEKIGAIIAQGVLNEETCNETHPMEIAIDGLIKNYEWLDYTTMAMRTEVCVQARVVIRESAPKMFIVTAYIFDVVKNHSLPEVNLEIW